MRFLPSDKYNVAWFKLAECVSRGERERALGVYRLLAHSFDDAAFARQLEGDILLAFDDSAAALDRYRDAITLYQQSNRLLEAAAVAEHVLTLDQHKQEYIVILAEMYCDLQITPKAIHYLHMLCALALGNNDVDLATTTLERLDELVTLDKTVAMRQQLLTLIIKQQPFPQDEGVEQIKKIIDSFMHYDGQTALQQFLMQLEVQNHSYYHAACLCMDEVAESAAL